LASINTNRGTATWRFALTANVHAQLTRFDTNVTGGGSIDQQTLNATTGSSASVIAGRYAFELIGVDQSFNPLSMAGEILANGSGSFSNTDAILDVNDNGISQFGSVTRRDTSLSGSYVFDDAFAGSGRGTLTLASSTTGMNPRTFAFYALGTPGNCSNQTTVCQLHLVETDGIAFTAGDMYLASSATGIESATYVFTTGGSSRAGAHAVGGVFTSNGAGATSNGTLDVNEAGTYNKGASLGSCSFSVDSTTGRVDLGLFPNSGTCPSISASGVMEFAAYPTALGSLIMLELDSSAVATGLAYQQCGPHSAGCGVSNPSLSANSMGFGLTGQGLFHSSSASLTSFQSDLPPANSASFQPDLDGQLSVSSSSVSAGSLDINNFTALFSADPVDTSGSSLASPTNGRGTLTLVATDPSGIYTFIYYLIDDDTALLFSSGKSLVAVGMAAGQF
jgi:hypothetical protein